MVQQDDRSTRQSGRESACPLRIYYVHPSAVGPLANWDALFDHAAALGFEAVLTAPLFEPGASGSVFTTGRFDRLNPALGEADTDEGIARLAGAARGRGLSLLVDVLPDQRVPPGQTGNAADPRLGPDLRYDRIDYRGDASGELDIWGERLAAWASAGIGGFRMLGLLDIPAEAARKLIETTRSLAPDTAFLAWTPGLPFETREALAGIGFDAAFSSLRWWDRRETWIVDEHEIHRSIGYDIAFPEAPFGRRIAHGVEGAELSERRARQALQLAGIFGDGVLIPMGFEFGVPGPLDSTYGTGGGLEQMRADGRFDVSEDVAAVNRRIANADELFRRRPTAVIGSATSPAGAIVKADHADTRRADKAEVVAFNLDLRSKAILSGDLVARAVGDFLPLHAEDGSRIEPGASIELAAGETRLFSGRRSKPIPLPVQEDAIWAAAAPRLSIENVTPAVDEGRFPVKRIVGETVVVEADIFGDGHDPLTAALLWRPADEEAWREAPMRFVINDRWQGSFPLERVGRYEFTVEAWRNPFAIFHHELEKKLEARLDLTLEIREGTILIETALKGRSGDVADRLRALLSRLARASAEERPHILLEDETSAVMAAADKRPFAARHLPIPLDAERKAAGFASWYELFPRSQSGDPARHGTFDDVIKRLPAIRKMGFDVVYFPPIHPIGKTNRKGRENTLHAAPDDPGSPYAIGSEAGGHDAIHPELGTFEDFRRLVDAAADKGIEVALDLAIQASPDHPWLKEHPGWFDWRPDGTIRYAENPPKKYEDIVNVDFYARDAIPGLWQTLRDIVQLWVDQGVRLFRVDNPHTKPFPFWEWLIADIRGRHPDVVFLSEAFTRPKVMYELAKIGFSQSYTYFTWRNAKWEFEQYLTELTTTAPKDFFRPHFFVNTHDINPDFLQNAPRPAYLIRAALAATLSGLWGVYNGFELCEGRPDAKRKEYAESEKYQLRAWDWDRPGNIIAEISALNRIRRDNPALQSHLGLTLLNAWNDNILFFEKATPARDNVVLVAISLDPHSPQEADVEIPLWLWGRSDHESLAARDLVRGNRFTWTGKLQHIRLDPGELPFSIWRTGPREA